jgi:ferredoxin
MHITGGNTMKINIVHLVLFSPCGGTANATKSLTRDITLQVVEYDITLPPKRGKELSFIQNDLVFFGFPVYGGRMPRNVEQIFAGLKGQDTPCVLVAVYGNRAFEGALLDLHGAATARGFKPVAAVAAIAEHSISPQVATNRPDKADCDLLAQFGLHILEQAKSGTILEKAPGAYPEWKSPAGASIFPVTDTENCTQCGQCVQTCPCGAISQDDPAKTDIQNCILCAACVKYCPQKARTLGTPETRAMFNSHLIAAAVTRKEAELFFNGNHTSVESNHY